MTTLDYTYDYRGYYAYVLVNCSRSECDKIIRVLRSEGLTISKTGTSSYPAWNGRQYDWYIRVTDARGEKPDKWRIQNILRDYSPEPVVPSNKIGTSATKFPKADNYRTSSRLTDAPDTSSIISDTVTLEQQLNQARHEIRKLESNRRTLEEALSQANAKIENLTSANNKLQSKVEELEAIPKTHLAVQQTAPDKLQSQLDEALGMQELFQEENNQLRTENMELKKVVEELKEKNARLEFDIEDLTKQAEAPMPETIIFQGLFPSVIPLQGTLQILLREVDGKARSKMLKILHQLAYSPAEIKARDSIQKAPGWREIDIDGRASKWRLYYKKIEQDYHVLIGEKKNQERDLRYLTDY